MTQSPEQLVERFERGEKLTRSELDIACKWLDVQMFIKPNPKPKPVYDVVVPVSPEADARIRAKPEKASVRVITEDEKGVTHVERRPVFERMEVLEVDDNGRPKVVRCHDVRTNSYSTLEYKDGYRPPNGVVHQYNPLDALDRD